MTEEIGVVNSLNGSYAVVKVPKKSSCDGCTLGTCKPDDQSMEIEALNKADAQVGQRVKVVISSFTYMKGSLLIYGFPAAALIIGAVLGKEVFSGYFPGTDSDILSALFGFSALVISFFLARIWLNRTSRKVESKPVIQEILGS
jgi:sigma-E factor negative regulatory protein RseC